jgi:hypothetical protein
MAAGYDERLVGSISHFGDPGFEWDGLLNAAAWHETTVT